MRHVIDRVRYEVVVQTKHKRTKHRNEQKNSPGPRQFRDHESRNYAFCVREGEGKVFIAGAEENDLTRIDADYPDFNRAEELFTDWGWYEL